MSYDADYILEEILCDYEAGMNIFSEEKVPSIFWEMSQEILQPDAVKADLVRGPPTEGMFSRAQRGRSIELETMENNRFQRLRQFHGDIPAQWYAYTRDFFYIYSNQSFTDYTILAKVSITSKNSEAIDSFTEELEHGTYEYSEAFDQWSSAFRRGKGRYRWDSIRNGNRGTAMPSDGVDGRKQRGQNARNSKEGSRIGTAEVTGPKEKFSRETSYAEQVDKVKNNTHDPNNHVYMGTTPMGIAKVLDLPKLPMLVTSQHIYSMAVSVQQAKADGRYRKRMNYHDLGWNAVKKLPEYIDKPVLLIKSNTDPNDATFVVITGRVDRTGNPIIAAVKPNGKGKYFDIEFPTNIMLSSYGKDGIQSYVATAKTENRILYASKKNSQKNKANPSVQFADVLLSSDYTTNLAEFKKIVNKKFEGTIFANSGLPKYIDGRFSREFIQAQMTEKEMLLDKANRMLERENSKLREDNEHLKELVKLQKTLTGGTKFTKTSVETMAKQLKSAANAKGDTKVLAKLLEDFYGYIAKGEEITWEGVLEQAQPVVDWLTANEVKPFVREAYAQEVLDFLMNELNYKKQRHFCHCFLFVLSFYTVIFVLINKVSDHYKDKQADCADSCTDIE